MARGRATLGLVVVPLACLRSLRRLVNGEIVKRKPPVSAFRPGYSRGSSTKVVPEGVEAQANEYGAQATTIRGVRAPSSGFWRTAE